MSKARRRRPYERPRETSESEDVEEPIGPSLESGPVPPTSVGLGGLPEGGAGGVDDHSKPSRESVLGRYLTEEILSASEKKC